MTIPTFSTKTDLLESRSTSKTPLQSWQTLLLWLFLISLLKSTQVLAQPHMEVIPLKHRPADTLLNAIKPMASPGSTLAAAGNKLLIKAEPAELALLKTLIDELDTPLAQFRISVKTGAANYRNNHNTAFSHQGDKFSVGSPGIKRYKSSDGTIIRHGSNSNSKTEVIVRRSSSLNSSDKVQQVRATEGYPAYIETGQQIPVTQLLFSSYDGRPIIDKQYRPVVSGFYVTPEISHGDGIRLQLSTTKQSLKHNKRIDTQSYSGTIHGKLNQWIQVAGIGDQDQNTKKGLTKRYRSDLSASSAIYLKVEKVQ